MATPARKIRALELYSGIGGMHFALNGSGIEYEVVMAVDVNTNANLVYSINFADTPLSASAIESLSVKKFDGLRIDMILMSPPCQPFTRVGKQKDTEDVRTKSFLHVLDLLKECKKCPSYILIENVKGFEGSDARQRLLATLNQRGYIYQELLLTPLQFGIPNSRLRYFLVAKLQPLKFDFDHSCQILEELPSCPGDWFPFKMQAEAEDQLSQKTQSQQQCACLQHQLKYSSHCKHSEKYAEDHTENSTIDTEHAAPQTTEDVENRECESKTHKRRKIDHKESEGKSEVDKKSVVTGEVFQKESEKNGDNSVKCLQNYGQNFRQTSIEDKSSHEKCLKLHHFLEEDFYDLDKFQDFLVPEKEFKRFLVMDVVNPCSEKTCCFTKRYGHFVEGAGSLVQMSASSQAMTAASELKTLTISEKNRHQWGVEELNIIRNLKLRYFTPREIANLLCFPSSLKFPESLTNRQLYMLLGNSLNVHVVSVLIRLLVRGDVLPAATL